MGNCMTKKKPSAEGAENIQPTEQGTKKHYQEESIKRLELPSNCRQTQAPPQGEPLENLPNKQIIFDSDGNILQETTVEIKPTESYQ